MKKLRFQDEKGLRTFIVVFRPEDKKKTCTTGISITCLAFNKSCHSPLEDSLLGVLSTPRQSYTFLYCGFVNVICVRIWQMPSLFLHKELYGSANIYCCLKKEQEKRKRFGRTWSRHFNGTCMMTWWKPNKYFKHLDKRIRCNAQHSHTCQFSVLIL